MASSGWQGRQTLYGYTGSWYCCAWAGDIAIDSIERHTDYIRVRGNTALVVETTSGCTGIWYNNRIGVKVQGEGGFTEIKGQTGYNIVSGTTYYHSFDITIGGLNASSTSCNISCSWLDLQNSSWLNSTKTWTIYFDSAATPPTGGSVSFVSSTWNSVRITSRVSSYGTGVSGTPYIEQIVLAAGSGWTPRLVRRWFTWDTTSTHSVTNANATEAFDGGISLRGCTSYKIGMWASTNNGNTSAIDETTRYTAPSPLASIAISNETRQDNANAVTTSVAVTGGSHDDNHTATVTTYIRYTTNGGGYWSGWQSIGTGNTWETKTGTITVPYNTSVTIEAKQVYNGQTSDIKSYTYTSITPVPPTGLTATATAATWNTVTVTGSCDYGHPNNITGRVMCLGVSATKLSLTYKRNDPLTDVASGTHTVDNTSSYVGNSPLELKGCMTVWPFVWADNTIWHSDYPQTEQQNGAAGFMFWGANSITTAPAPLESVDVVENEITSNTATRAVISIVSSSGDNVAGSVLKTQYRYSVDGNGSTYTNWTDCSGTSVAGAEVLQELTGLPQNTRIYVQVRQYQTGVNNCSEVTTINFVSRQSVIHLDYNWNDTRDALLLAGTVSANATRCEILWGYTPALGNTLVSAAGSNAQGTIQYPNHGTGQVIYARVRAVYLDGTVELGNIKAITVYNPVIGVSTHSNGDQYYIVDIVEHKTDDTVTPRWQNGQRVVKN